MVFPVLGICRSGTESIGASGIPELVNRILEVCIFQKVALGGEGDIGRRGAREPAILRRIAVEVSYQYPVVFRSIRTLLHCLVEKVLHLRQTLVVRLYLFGCSVIAHTGFMWIRMRSYYIEFRARYRYLEMTGAMGKIGGKGLHTGNRVFGSDFLRIVVRAAAAFDIAVAIA